MTTRELADELTEEFETLLFENVAPRLAMQTIAIRHLGSDLSAWGYHNVTEDDPTGDMLYIAGVSLYKAQAEEHPNCDSFRGRGPGRVMQDGFDALMNALDNGPEAVDALLSEMIWQSRD